MAENERVLVVEDDDDIRDVMREVLTAEGYCVEVARDGQDALGKLEVDGHPMVILLDMMMPRMDGETFIKELRCKPQLADAQVVVISGNAAVREKADKLRAAACLVKPFELDELLGVVRRLVRGGVH